MNWRDWVSMIAGAGFIACVLWQLPFPSSVLIILSFYTCGDAVNRLRGLEKWRQTEEEIARELAQREQRGSNTTH